MQRKLSVSLLYCVTIIAVCLTLPLPSPRYRFEHRDKAYSNTQFETMIYDTWTGGVRYACEARLENPNDSRNPTQESITRVINAGSFPLALILERLLVLAAVWVIASKGIRYLMTADSTPEETGA